MERPVKKLPGKRQGKRRGEIYTLKECTFRRRGRVTSRERERPSRVDPGVEIHGYGTVVKGLQVRRSGQRRLDVRTCRWRDCDGAHTKCP